MLGVSVSGYYAWRNRPESKRSIENRALLSDIRCAHGGQVVDAMAPRAFTPFYAPRVEASGGEEDVANRPVNGLPDERIARLMRAAGLRGLAAIPRRVRTTNSRHDYPPLGETVHRTVS